MIYNKKEEVNYENKYATPLWDEYLYIEFTKVISEYYHNLSLNKLEFLKNNINDKNKNTCTIIYTKIFLY